MNAVPKILLVDDEERFVKSLQVILDHYGFNTTAVLSGGEAISLLKSEKFELALLDINLPDLNGIDILEFINASDINTSVIMLTGISTVEMAVTSIKQGAYDFLSKPINHDLLLKTIEKALQHRALKEELIASEKRFHVLADACTEGVVIHDAGKLIDANKQFLNLFGYTREELEPGIFYEKLLSPHHLGIVQEKIKNSYWGSYEIFGIRKDGRQFPIEVNSRQIHYFGRPVRICTIKDLTERVKIEEERLNLQKNLAKIGKLQSLGMMAGSVAHDLNNILVGIVSFPETLLYTLDKNDNLYSGIKRIQEAGKRAATVVADLLLVARGGSINTTTYNLNEIISYHIRSLEHQELISRYPNTIVQTDLQQDLYDIRCSVTHIQKILLNLINNALEATRNNGVILITTKNCKFSPPYHNSEHAIHETDYVKLVVSDNGPGIAEDHLDRIFDPFFTTKRIGKSGTGLGLSIVWNVIQQHNGWIEAKNTHHGACFEIYLPAEVGEARKSSNESILKLQEGMGEKILLIDDQQDQNEVLGLMLTNLGYTTDSVTSGESGIEYLKRKTADLVIIDMDMGKGLNGRETYERILQISPKQKGIILSGSAHSKDFSRAKELGISFCLEKPVTMDILSAAVKQTLRDEFFT